MKDMLKYLSATLTAALLSISALAPIARAEDSPQYFASPEEAVKALVQAAESPDPTAELSKLSGQKPGGLMGSYDQEDQKLVLKMFLEAYKKKHSLTPVTGDKREEFILEVGADRFELPIPIVKKTGKEGEQGNGQWFFDVNAGYDQLLTRYIGRNELNVLQVCLAVVDAQREYYLMNPQGNGPSYAARIISTPGKKDGLYWHTDSAQTQSPIGLHFANASILDRISKDSKDKIIPYHGYFFRLLPGQGANAAGGAFNYADKDNRVVGFALLAYPAAYRRTGIMSFMVNQDGTVYEKDLGPKTHREAMQIKLFNPDGSWKKVREDNLRASKDDKDN